ncbi:MAG: hypothetical protein BAJATHORv1_10095 [Candidatus Thorarchaeota archaeon]|nr:MAG: hypothetical protein BAJATHORv1_10095 [Candidatus Thorarchaeota archaeon]
MIIDEGTLLVFQSAQGAYACRNLPIPNHWDSYSRPHVALLLPNNGDIFRIFLSRPNSENQSEGITFSVSDLETIPDRSIVEIRYNCTNYCFYRRDRNNWTKVAESDSPFMVEVFSFGCESVLIETSPFPQPVDVC